MDAVINFLNQTGFSLILDHPQTLIMLGIACFPVSYTHLPHTSLASLLFASTLDTSFNDQLANFKAFSSEERFEFLKGCVLSVGLDENIIDKNNPEYDMVKTEKDLFNCIEKVKDLSYEHKYHLLLLYYHFEDLLQELHTILLDTLSIMEPFFREMQVTVTDFVEDFKRNLTEHGLRCV